MINIGEKDVSYRTPYGRGGGRVRRAAYDILVYRDLKKTKIYWQGQANASVISWCFTAKNCPHVFIDRFFLFSKASPSLPFFFFFSVSLSRRLFSSITYVMVF